MIINHIYNKQILKIILTALIVILITILLIEIGLRILVLFPTNSALFINDSDIGFRIRPNAVVKENLIMNSFGFNDIKHNPQKKIDKIRIAIIGDSFVFGAVPREQNFTFILQTLLAKKGIDIEVLNMGIPAAGLRQYLSLLKKRCCIDEC